MCVNITRGDVFIFLYFHVVFYPLCVLLFPVYVLLVHLFFLFLFVLFVYPIFPFPILVFSFYLSIFFLLPVCRIEYFFCSFYFFLSSYFFTLSHEKKINKTNNMYESFCTNEKKKNLPVVSCNICKMYKKNK